VLHAVGNARSAEPICPPLMMLTEPSATLSSPAGRTSTAMPRIRASLGIAPELIREQLVAVGSIYEHDLAHVVERDVFGRDRGEVVPGWRWDALVAGDADDWSGPGVNHSASVSGSGNASSFQRRPGQAHVPSEMRATSAASRSWPAYAW